MKRIRLAGDASQGLFVGLEQMNCSIQELMGSVCFAFLMRVKVQTLKYARLRIAIQSQIAFRQD